MTVRPKHPITMFMAIVLILCNSTIYGQTILCPQNIDFEDGTPNYWEFSTGSCCPISTPVASGPVHNRHTLMFGIAADPYGGFPIVAPGGGGYSLKLGNDDSKAQAEKARYYVHVPNGPNLYSLIYRYAVVFQDPGHDSVDQPRFEVRVFDSTNGDELVCNHHVYVANSNLPGFKKAPQGIDVYYRDWTTATIDLSGYAGKTVVVEFATGDCKLGGHFGYGYIDLSCGFFQVHNLSCNPAPFVTLKAPPGFQHYKWMDTTFAQTYGNTQNINIATPQQSTKYAVILSPYAGFGCKDTLFMTVARSNLITKVANDTIICKGSNALLDVQSNSIGTPLSYNWTPSTDLSCTSCPNPVATPSKTTKYYITVADTSGCSKRDSVYVIVRSAVDPEITVNEDSVCETVPVELKNLGQNPLGIGYFWNIDSGKIYVGQGTEKAIAYWNDTGKKRIILKITNQGCIERDTAEIYVKYQPEAVINLPKYGCVNDEIIIRPVEQFAKYTWDIDEQTILDSTYVDYYNLVWRSIGKKNIHLLLNNKNGCFHELDTSINIYEHPIATIKSDVNSICKGKRFNLSTIEGSRYLYSWSPPQYFSSNDDHTVSGFAEVTGNIHLTVTNQWGCSSSDSFFIYAGPCCEVFMPTAFTPNADGRNDYFHPVDMKQHELVHFMVMNRWGELIFESKTLDQGWDGTYKNQKAPTGTYYYYMKYVCNEGDVIHKKGSIILIR